VKAGTYWQVVFCRDLSSHTIENPIEGYQKGRMKPWFAVEAPWVCNAIE
jgi:hypothetical protein